jgi:hypothetical protein
VFRVRVGEKTVIVIRGREGELPRFDNSQNVKMIWLIRLLWIWDTELAANLACEKIGNLSVSWNRSNAAGIGEIDIFAVLCPLVGENAPEPLQVSNEFSPLHLHLDLFDHYLVFG